MPAPAHGPPGSGALDHLEQVGHGHLGRPGQKLDIDQGDVPGAPLRWLVLELNAALLQEAFPPKTDQIDFGRPKGAGPYYEWRNRSGWLVRCRDDDAVTIEWVGEKGL